MGRPLPTLRQAAWSAGLLLAIKIPAAVFTLTRCWNAS